ncbi:MAG: hypothetical protein IJF17_12120, partial [Thermoguttaceae bacterium]|nr:hypothetical protein [Thermoguttaceae bacterium]
YRPSAALHSHQRCSPSAAGCVRVISARTDLKADLVQTAFRIIAACADSTSPHGLLDLVIIVESRKTYSGRKQQKT